MWERMRSRCVRTASTITSNAVQPATPLIRRGDTFFREDDPYCQECYHSVCDRDAIHDYYYKPTPIFYGDGNRFFGVELEIDGAR